jgi:hypothetical protein
VTLTTVVDKDTVVIFSVTTVVTVDDTDDFSAVTLVATDTVTVVFVTILDAAVVSAAVLATTVDDPSSHGGMTQTQHTLLVVKRHESTFKRSIFIFQ